MGCSSKFFRAAQGKIVTPSSEEFTTRKKKCSGKKKCSPKIKVANFLQFSNDILIRARISTRQSTYFYTFVPFPSDKITSAIWRFPIENSRETRKIKDFEILKLDK